MNKIRFNEATKAHNDFLQRLDDKSKEDFGYYLLRTNYKVDIKAKK